MSDDHTEITDLPHGAVLAVYEQTPGTDDRSPMFVLTVLGVEVLIRRRNTETYVHVDSTNVPGWHMPLLLEVNNGGENPYGERPTYTLVDEGTVEGVQYVTVLDDGDNPVEYNVERDKAIAQYMPDGEDQ